MSSMSPFTQTSLSIGLCAICFNTSLRWMYISVNLVHIMLVQLQKIKSKINTYSSWHIIIWLAYKLFQKSDKLSLLNIRNYKKKNIVSRNN